jgi:hypothetical protein
MTSRDLHRRAADDSGLRRTAVCFTRAPVRDARRRGAVRIESKCGEAWRAFAVEHGERELDHEE